MIGRVLLQSRRLSTQAGNAILKVDPFECSLSSMTSLKGREIAWHLPEKREGQVPAIVFLHDGLGSSLSFREFPERVVSLARTPCRAFVYDRAGHGESSAIPSDLPYGSDFHFREAERLSMLLSLLKRDFDRVVLVGVGDGATIALVHAATSSSMRPSGCVLMSPRLVIEQRIVDSVAQVKTTKRDATLAEISRYHHNRAEAVLTAWSDMWLSDEFTENFDVRGLLKSVSCPLQVIVGENDPFVSYDIQVKPIVESCSDVNVSVVPGADNAPFLELSQPSRRSKATTKRRVVVSQSIAKVVSDFASRVLARRT